MPKIIFNSIWFSADGSIIKSLMNNYSWLKEKAKDRGDEFEFVVWTDKSRLNPEAKAELEKQGIKVMDYLKDHNALDDQAKFLLKITHAAVEIAEKSNIKLYYAIASDIFRILLLSKLYPADPAHRNDIALYIDGNDVSIHRLPDPTTTKLQMENENAGLAFSINELHLINSRVAACNDVIIADLSQKEMLAHLAQLVTNYLIYLDEQYKDEGGLIGKFENFTQINPSTRTKSLFTFLTSNSLNYLYIGKNNQVYGLNWQGDSVDFQKMQILNADQLVSFDSVPIQKFGQTDNDTSATMAKTTWLERDSSNQTKSPEWENFFSHRISMLDSLSRVADMGLSTKEVSAYLLKAKCFPDEITNGYIQAVKSGDPEALENYKKNIERFIRILEHVDKSFEFKSDSEFQNMLIALKILEENKLLEPNVIEQLLANSNHAISFAKSMVIFNNDPGAMDFYSSLTKLIIDPDSAVDQVLADVRANFDESYAEAFVKLNKADLLDEALIAFLHKTSEANQTNINEEVDKMIALRDAMGDEFKKLQGYINTFDRLDLFKKYGPELAMHFELLQILFKNKEDATNEDFFEIAENLASSNLPYENLLLKGISALKENGSLNLTNYGILKNLLEINHEQYKNTNVAQQNLLIKMLEKIVQGTKSREPSTASEFKLLLGKLSGDATYQHALVQMSYDKASSNNNINVYQIKDQIEGYVTKSDKLEVNKYVS